MTPQAKHQRNNRAKGICGCCKGGNPLATKERTLKDGTIVVKVLSRCQPCMDRVNANSKAYYRKKILPG